MIVALADRLSQIARDQRILAYAANAAGKYDVADSLIKNAREIELRASYARPRSAVVVPIRSQTSFGIDPQGAA